MRPPLAGRRPAARRLAARLRRVVAPVEHALPVSLRGAGSGGRAAAPDAPAPDGAAAPPAPAPPAPPADAAARIDAARQRLRATIEPPTDGG